MSEHEFEAGMMEELEGVLQLLKVRRRAVIMSISKEATWTQRTMGQIYAMGAIESALWRLERRARGEE